MLTQDDLTQLKKPFAASDHEFLNGMAYITEHAITERIETVDPAWAFQVRSISVRDSAGEGGKDIYTVTVHAALTINGVTRDNVGMASVQKSDLKDETIWNNNTRKKEPTGKQYTIEANEAEKSATTDALKRCARLFAIGRYLLTLPSDVKDEASMARWLKAQGTPQTVTTGNGLPGSTPSNVTTIPNASGSNLTIQAPDENTWKRWVFDATKFLYTDTDGNYKDHLHRESLKKRMDTTGEYAILPTMTLYEVLNRVMRYRALKDMFIDSGDYEKVFGELGFQGFVDTYGHVKTWQRMNAYYLETMPSAKAKAANQ
jgi:hypothetical protein